MLDIDNPVIDNPVKRPRTRQMKARLIHDSPDSYPLLTVNDSKQAKQKEPEIAKRNSHKVSSNEERKLKTGRWTTNGLPNKTRLSDTLDSDWAMDHSLSQAERHSIQDKY
jgi:hypothetical protein